MCGPRRDAGMEILTKIINQISDDDSGTVGYPLPSGARRDHTEPDRVAASVCRWLYAWQLPAVSYVERSRSCPQYGVSGAAAHRERWTRSGARACRFDELKSIIINQLWKVIEPSELHAAPHRIACTTWQHATPYRNMQRKHATCNATWNATCNTRSTRLPCSGIAAIERCCHC